MSEQPSTDHLKDVASDCVHCGFCLPACPTYQLWGEEMDSPRGRIYLMKSIQEGKAALGPTVVAHFDRCLGCMGCVTACPCTSSGAGSGKGSTVKSPCEAGVGDCPLTCAM